MASKYAMHVSNWSDCQRCVYGETRTRIVLARGKVPADIVFVGEAPGVSEDVIGQPFTGPAGRILDIIIARSLPAERHLCGRCKQDVTAMAPDAKYPGCPKCRSHLVTTIPAPRVAITNIVACLPVEGDSGEKAVEPEDECVLSCQPRLAEFVEIADPRLVVCVGKIASGWLDPQYKHGVKFHKKIPRVEIIHPASILRANVAMQGLLVQRAVVTVTNAVREFIEGK